MTTIKGIKRLFARPARLGLMAVACLMAGGALAAGFDGMTLVTNNWFAADFTAQTAGTVITQGSTTGISSGAGSWTSVPALATAQIVADADAGGEATLLSINAEEGELTFTPAALATATGMATVTVDVKTIAVDTLPTPEGGAQGAFAIYSPDGEAHSLAAYVSDGTSGVWTNLVYASAADLTNVWFTLTLDFATVSNVRYVRYSITPPAGSLTILEDTEGTQWFQSASNATTVASVSFTGTGNIRTFSGDSLADAVASYNGVNYDSVAAAVTAGEADSWAHGSVSLLANATWAPTAAGTYNIDVASFELDVTATDYTLTVDAMAGNVTAARIYTWNGSTDTWLAAANWTVGSDAHAAATYPGEVSTEPFTVIFAKNATFASSETVALGDMTVQAAGYTVTLPRVSVPDLATSENNHYYSTAYTRIESGTVIVANTGFLEHNVTIAQDAKLILNKDTTAQKNWFQWFKGAGTLIVDGAKFDYSANGNYGSAVTGFEGTLIGRNGAELVLTSNRNQENQLGKNGTFVFSGVTVSPKLASSTLSNSAFEIVAGTVNTMSTLALPLAKTTIVNGDVTLDKSQQYVLITVDAYTGTLPTVADELASDGWLVKLTTDEESGKKQLVLTQPQAYVWTGAAGDSLWATPGNWTVGGEIPMTAPGAGDTVSITTAEETLDVVVADGQNVGTLTKGDNVTLVGPGPYEVAVSDAGEVTLTRVAGTFVWAGSNGDKWVDTASWTVNGRATDVVPSTVDAVTFTANAEVDIANGSANVNFKTLDITDVRVLVTGGTLVMNSGTISETGTLALSNATFSVAGSSDVTVNNTFEFVDGSSNTIIPPGAHKINFYGALTGGGDFTVSYVSGNYPSIEVYGSAADFSGTATIPATGKNEQNRLRVNDFKKSYWNIYPEGSANIGYQYIFQAATKYYYLGGINATVPSRSAQSKTYFYIGYLERDSYLGGTLCNDSYGADIHWVANTTTLTLNASGSQTDVKSLFIDGTGIVVLKSVKSIPKTRIVFGAAGGTLKFTSDVPSANRDISTLLNNNLYDNQTITYENAEGETDTWATALNSTNKGGLVKKGGGTLVLGAAPGYTGTTTVEAGTLVVTNGTSAWEYTLGADTKASLAMDGDIYVYTLTPLTSTEKPEAVEGVITVPDSMDGVSAVYAITPGETIDCSALTKDATGIKATVSTTVGGETVDATSYYKPISLTVNGGTTIVPELADSVKPTVVTDGSDAPMELTTSTVSFNVSNFKKGLYYGISVGTSPDGLKREAALEQATDDSGTGVDLSSGMPDIGVKYYRIVVSDVPLAAE